MTNRFTGQAGQSPSQSAEPPARRREVLLGRAQEVMASRRVQIGVIAALLGTLLLLVLPRLLPGVNSEEFLVLVAPFETSSPDTGRALAGELARAIEDSGDGRMVAQVLDAAPASPDAAAALAASRGADALIYGRAADGALLADAAITPALVYRPNGSYAPIGWDGYLARFTLPRHYDLAARPVSGAALARLLSALDDYGAGRVDGALRTLDDLETQDIGLRDELPMLLRANIEWARGDYAPAAADYRRAIAEASPQNVALLYTNLGAVLYDAGDGSARDAFNQAVTLLAQQGGDLGELRYNLALEALRAGDTAAAVTAFDALAPLDVGRRLLPPSTMLLIDASRAYRLGGQFDKAGEMLAAADERAAIDDVQTTPELRDMLILRLTSAVAAERAQLQLTREVGARGPLLWELQARGPLSESLVKSLESRSETALTQSQRAVDLWNRRSAAEDAANNTVAGRIALSQAQRTAAAQEATQRFRTVIDIERLRVSGPRASQGLDGLWAMLTGTGSPVSPIRQQLEQRFADEPANPEPHVLLGTAYQIAGEADAARQQFEEAARLAPQAPEPLYGLAVAALPGDRAQARERLTRAIALDASYFPARLRLAELAEQERDWATAVVQREWLAQNRPGAASTLALATALRLSGPQGYARAEAALLPLANQSQPRALIELAELYRAANNRPAAHQALDRAQRVTPRGDEDYPDVMYELGRLLADEQNVTEAEIQFEAALSAEPRHIPSLLALAQINRDDPPSATRYYRSALDVGADDPQVLRRIGGELLGYREFELAAQAFERAVAAAPGDPELHYGLALASLHQDDAARAESEARAAIVAAGGSYPDAQVILGDVALKRGDIAAASEEYNAALRQNDGLAAGYIGLGRAAVAEGRWAVATGHFRNAVARDPTSAEAALWLGEALMQDPNNSPAGAAASYQAAIDIRPDYAEAYLGLAQAQIQLGTVGEAQDSLARAIAIRPDYAEAYLVRGRLAEQQADENRAIEDYGRAIAAGDRLAEPHFRRALLMIRANRLDDARGDLERAVELQPNFPEAHYWLGRANYAQERYPDAVENFRRAAGLQPSYAEARYYQGLAEEHAGRAGEAVVSYRTAAEQGSGTIWFEEAQKALVRLGAQ